MPRLRLRGLPVSIHIMKPESVTLSVDSALPQLRELLLDPGTVLSVVARLLALTTGCRGRALSRLKQLHADLVVLDA